MVKISKFCLLFSLFLSISCESNEDIDCSAALCAEPSANFIFEILSPSGINLFQAGVLDKDKIKVTDVDGNEVSYQFMEGENDDLLQILTAETTTITVSHDDTEIFNFTAEGEMRTSNCCTSFELKDISISKEYEQDATTGNYIIKIDPNTLSGSRVEFNYYENASFNLLNDDQQIEIVSGENLVFEYIIFKDPYPLMVDDETTEYLYFETDAELTELDIETTTFEDFKVTYGIFCFCGKTGYFPADSGVITGEKIEPAQWQISLDVTNTYTIGEDEVITQYLQDSGIFKLQSISEE